MPVEINPARLRAVLRVGGFRLRALPGARIEAAATFAATPLFRAVFSAEALVDGQIAKATRHAAPLSAAATCAAMGIQKATSHVAPLAGACVIVVRLQRSGYVRYDSAGNRRVTSTGDVRVAVQASS